MSNRGFRGGKDALFSVQTDDTRVQLRRGAKTGGLLIRVDVNLRQATTTRSIPLKGKDMEAMLVALVGEAATPLTNRELVDNCNELARTFYKMQGYQVGPDFKFYDSTHPHERGMWNTAVVAYEHVNGTDIAEVLDELTDEEDD